MPGVKYGGRAFKKDGKARKECCCVNGCCDFTAHTVPCIGIRIIFLDGYPVVPCMAPDTTTGLNYQDFEWIAYSPDGGGIWGAVNSFWNGAWGQSFNVDCAVIDNRYVWSGVSGDCSDDTYANKLAGVTTLSCNPFHVIWKGPDNLGHPMSNAGCCSSTDDPAGKIYVEAYEIECPPGVGGGVEGEVFMSTRSSIKERKYTIGVDSAIKSSNTIMLPEKPKYSIGPGTAIKAELAKWGIHPKEKKCKCNDIAAAMDELGPDELERNLDLYVAKMRESFKEWRGGIPIPTPPDFILRQIIEYGISTSRDSLIN